MKLKAVTAIAPVPDRPRSPYLTSREACEYLRINSLSSLYRHIRQNRLPVLRAGGDLRFDIRELDAWLRGTSSIELVRDRRRSHVPKATCQNTQLVVR